MKSRLPGPESGLILGEVQQPVGVRPDQGVTPIGPLPVQREHDSPIVAVVFLPPAGVGDELVGVLVGEVIEIMVGDFDGEAVRRRAGR